MKSLKSAPDSLQRAQGFTLIELMIVITLIGILSSIAVTAYVGYTRSADRAEVQGDVYEIAQIMERSYTDDQDYRTSELVTDANALDIFESRNPKYDFSVTAAAANQFIVQALALPASRDDFDIRIDHRGTEEFAPQGTTNWQRGWDNIR